MNKNPDHPQLKFNPIMLLALALIFAFVLGVLIPLPFISRTPARILGALVFLAGFAIAIPAARGMAIAKTSPRPDSPTTTLVLGGTYRFSRNPIYLSMLFNFAGVLIFLQNLWLIPILPLLIWLITIWVIVPEEQYLEGKFGQQYLDFKTRVRRWI